MDQGTGSPNKEDSSINQAGVQQLTRHIKYNAVYLRKNNQLFVPKWNFDLLW